MRKFLFAFAATAALGILILVGDKLAFRSPLSPFYLPRWAIVDAGLERMVYLAPFDHDVITLYRFSPQAYRLQLMYNQTPARVADWAAQTEGESLVINGVYFTDTFVPTGSLIIDGESVGSVSFDLDKSGYVVTDPEFAIVNTALEPFDPAQVQAAAQSYPFLIWDGESTVSQDSGLQARRTFIGQDTTGWVYIGVVARDSISLYDLSQALLSMDVAWQSVLNLDGGPSTGLVAHTKKRTEVLNSGSAVPNVFVITKKQ